MLSAKVCVVYHLGSLIQSPLHLLLARITITLHVSLRTNETLPFVQRNRLGDSVDHVRATNVISDIAGNTNILDAKLACAIVRNFVLSTNTPCPFAICACDVTHEDLAIRDKRGGGCGLVLIGVGAAFGQTLQRVARVAGGGGVGLRWIRPGGPGNLRRTDRQANVAGSSNVLIRQVLESWCAQWISNSSSVRVPVGDVCVHRSLDQFG